MNKPHKHAKLIKAWADGAEIQYKTPTCTDWNSCKEPSWIHTWEYRIKPDIPEGFTKWNGGKCPVDPKCFVEIKMRGGRENRNFAGDFYWENRECSNDIVAYKVIKNAPIVRWQWITVWKGSKPQISRSFFTEQEVSKGSKPGLTIIGKAEWSRMEFDE